jgi:hypothetical protein
MTLLEAALAYAAKGWPVFPLEPRGKVPLGGLAPRGFHNATCDPSIISNWWALRPDANIGVATGGVFGVALDVDPRDGGLDSIRALEAEHGDLPETLIYETGSGGYHFLFETVPGMGNGEGTLGPGINVRGDGTGYIVAPPSVHPNGRRYKVAMDKVPVPMPSWLRAVIQGDRHAEPYVAAGFTTETTAFGKVILDRQTARLEATPVGEGRRRKALMSSALVVGKFVAGGEIAEADGLAALLDAAKAITTDGKYSDAELRRHLVGGLQAGFATPRKAPVNWAAKIKNLDFLSAGSDATEASRPAVPDRPEIVWSESKLHEVLPVVIEVLRQRDNYIRAGSIVKVGSPGIGAAPEAIVYRKGSLRLALSEAVQFLIAKVQKDQTVEYVPIGPPSNLLDAILDLGDWDLHKLRAVTAYPTITPDGHLIDTAGFDTTTGIYYWPDCEYPELPGRVTQEFAAECMRLLQTELLSDFPLQDPCHVSGALALLLTTVARPALEGSSPLFLVGSSTPGAGKGLLADALACVVFGRPAPKKPQAPTNEEEEKRINACIISGKTLYTIDNVSRRLGGDALDAAVTSTEWEGRVLGKSLMFLESMRMLFVATGNNVQFAGDMARRVVPITIVPEEERPELRTNFRHRDLLAFIQENRADLHMAALAILKGYCDAGKPDMGIPPYGGFEAWSRFVRSALVWAGAADPLSGSEDIREEADGDFTDFSRLLQAWETFYGDHAPTSAELAATLEREQMSSQEKTENLKNFKDSFAMCVDLDQVTARKIGNWLKAKRNRWFKGRRLVAVRSPRDGMRWRCESSPRPESQVNPPASLWNHGK